MIVRVLRFEPWHLTALERQPIQAAGDDEPDPQVYADGGPAWTVLGPEGLPVACAGFMLAAWPGQALAWSQLGTHLGALMVPFTRRVRLEFNRAGLERIEAVVQSGHAEGHRWCRLLGMAREGTLRRWGPKAIDHDLYAKVRGA